MGNRAGQVIAAIFASLLAVILPSAQAPAQDAAAVVVDNVNGYSVRFPDGWERIPDEVLKTAVASITKPNATGPRFEAAYEPSSHSNYFQYPYVMVQVHRHPSGKSFATISRSEIEQMAAQFAGVSSDEIKKHVSDDVAKAMGNLAFEKIAVSSSPPGFTMGSTTNLAGVGPLRSRCVALFGRTNIVMIHTYVPVDDWPTHAAALDAITSSFQRTADEAVTFSDKTVSTDGKNLSGGIDWGKVWAKALGGAIVGAILGLISWIKHRKRDKGNAAEKSNV